jgi:hypothetical protein
MMVLVTTVVGEFGLCSLLLCEEVLVAAVALAEVMEMVLVSLLLNLTTIMAVMYYFRLLTVTVLLSTS